MIAAGAASAPWGVPPSWLGMCPDGGEAVPVPPQIEALGG